MSDAYNGKIYSINMMTDKATILVDSVARRMSLGRIITSLQVTKYIELEVERLVYTLVFSLSMCWGFVWKSLGSVVGSDVSTYTISDLSEASKCLSTCIQCNLCKVLHLGNLQAACHFFWSEGIPPTCFHMAQDDFILT